MFHYVHFNPRSGNAKAELHIEDFQPIANFWQKGGIMIRESLEPNSRHASFYYTSSFISSQWRQCTGCYSDHYTPNANQRPKPIWLQVTKSDNTFTSSYKYNEADTWTPFHSVTINFASTEFYVGIAVTAHDNTQAVTLTAREFVVEDM